MDTNQETPETQSESLAMPDEIIKATEISPEPANTTEDANVKSENGDESSLKVVDENKAPSAPESTNSVPEPIVSPSNEPTTSQVEASSIEKKDPALKPEEDLAELVIKKLKRKQMIKIGIIILNFALIALLLYYYFFISNKK